MLGFGSGCAASASRSAHMRQRLLETLEHDVQPVGGPRVGRLGADAGRRPHRRHHGHLVLHRVEDHDQGRPHQDAVGKAKRIGLGRRQILDQPHRVVAHIAEDAGGHGRQLRRKLDGGFGKQRAERGKRRQRRRREGRCVGLRRAVHFGAPRRSPARSDRARSR